MKYWAWPHSQDLFSLGSEGESAPLFERKVFSGIRLAPTGQGFFNGSHPEDLFCLVSNRLVELIEPGRQTIKDFVRIFVGLFGEDAG